MSKRLYAFIRDLHLYFGLFVAPFLLLFSVSVVFLVHAWIPASTAERGPPVHVDAVSLPSYLESLDGRARVDALRTALPSLGITGEIGFVRHIPKERRMIFAVIAPGREAMVTLDLGSQSASIQMRDTGIWDGLVTLHKSPGPHLVAIRMNWLPMLAWRWFSDGTVYLILFLTLSGIYMWAMLRAERIVGLALLACGALSFIGIIYGIVY